MEQRKPRYKHLCSDREACQRVRLDPVAHRSRTAHTSQRSRIILACTEDHENKVVAKDAEFTAARCSIRNTAGRGIWTTVHPGDDNMFRLIATMRRGSATGIDAAWAHYSTIEAARLGSATLLHDDRVLRAMIVRDETPPAFVEWAER
jgi:hypothetical protein